jgi:hypothetical protein
MSIMVDHEPLAADVLGLRTVGQVLSHVQRDNRLVVQLLIDGREPDLDQMTRVRQAMLTGHTLYIETAEPQEMALEVLGEVESQLAEVDRLKSDACELLQQGNPGKAMEKLSGCFSIWHAAQEAVLKVAQLLRVDLSALRVSDVSLAEMAAAFGDRLRDIRSALENRDFVMLADTLEFEMTETSAQWRAAVESLRSVIGAV